MPGSVLIAGARTPIGRLLGVLSEFTAPELGAAAIAGALSRSGVRPEDVDAVIMGNVIQAALKPGAGGGMWGHLKLAITNALHRHGATAKPADKVQAAIAAAIAQLEAVRVHGDTGARIRRLG